MWEREKQRKYFSSVAEKERKSERERKSISRKESDYEKMSERMGDMREERERERDIESGERKCCRVKGNGRKKEFLGEREGIIEIEAIIERECLAEKEKGV